MALAAANPGLLGRGAWEADDARRDVQLLSWVGRFRFVTAKATADWLGVTPQRANARVSRLVRLRLLGSYRRHVADPRAIYLTTAGAELFGLSRRRRPRLDIQREHEQAIVWMATQLERTATDIRVLTERECHRHDAQTAMSRYRVDVPISRRNERYRWPDLVIERDRQRIAIEIELSPKTTERLERIVRGYSASDYKTVRFYVANEALGERIELIARRRYRSTTRFVVAAWPP